MSLLESECFPIPSAIWFFGFMYNQKTRLQKRPDLLIENSAKGYLPDIFQMFCHTVVIVRT